jgi:hypothetical protein
MFPGRVTPKFLCALGLLSALVAALPASRGQTSPIDPPRSQRVFVAGHSFHMPIARILDQIARGAGIAGEKLAGTQGIGGSSVTKHWELADDQDRARKAIRAGQVDVLTLSPFLNPMPDPAIAKFTALLLENNPQGRVTVQASWYPMDGPGNDPRTFTNAKRDDADPTLFHQAWAPFTDKLRAQVESLNAEFAPRAGRPVVFLVPVGEAVIRLRERVVKGEVPGIAKQSALFRDNLGHGNAPISVLTAYCHYAVIYGRNPVGLPVPDTFKAAEPGKDTEAINRVLQEVAWEAVTAEPLSGVKPPK